MNVGTGIGVANLPGRGNSLSRYRNKKYHGASSFSIADHKVLLGQRILKGEINCLICSLPVGIND